MIRVLLADDQPLVRAGLTVVLETAGDITVVGEAADGDQAVDIARRIRPDVVCMDIRMPGHDGIDATRRIGALDGKAIPVLIITTFDTDEYVFGALEAGAAGFLLKGADETTLINAVRSVASGLGTLDQTLTRTIIREFGQRSPKPRPQTGGAEWMLTAKELDVLRLLCDGLSNVEIGQNLHVQPSTVKFHIASILTKTGARDRLQAAVWAFRNNVAVGPVATGLAAPKNR